MQKIIQNIKLKKEAIAPPSKSMMQRILAIALIKGGMTKISNPSYCNDAKAAIEIIKAMNSRVEISEDSIKINAEFEPKKKLIHCGESGLCMRMFSSIVSLSGKELILDGEKSLQRRPISMIEKPLKQLGVKVKTNNGFLPIRIQGIIKGGFAELNGELSSQFLTGLLMTLPYAKEDSILKVINLKSKPYIDMTIGIMKDFGVKVINENYRKFFIKGNQKYIGENYLVEGDWSGSAFLLVAAAISGEINLKNISYNSTQGDKIICDILKECGAEIKIKDREVFVKKKKLKSFKFDATNYPDLFPPLVSLAANCDGITEIKGVKRLIHKESNRAEVLKKEFWKIGIKIEIADNVMKIFGSRILGGRCDANNDHRIAMALTVVALNSENEIILENSESVEKSWPDFYENFIFT